MSKDNKNNQLLGSQLLSSDIVQAMELIKESNQHARKRNKLVKRQYRQSVLDYEQAERQYLIEKSSLQPKFRLSVTEFLTCKPDFVNDPEQASEAKYLSGQGVGLEQRVLRLKLDTKGDAHYMRPSIVISDANKSADQRAYSMTDLIYFAEVANVDAADGDGSITVFLVYRDKTTLPVIHKYRLTPNHDLTLPRWDTVQLDTIYVGSHKDSPSLNSSTACAQFFVARDHF
ncbi:MAG: hypothetical protein JKX81_18600 [Arenicella sp.]|nr:hypothetical protein [Arenicella sp.]